MHGEEQWVTRLDARGIVVMRSLSHSRCAFGMRSGQYPFFPSVRNEREHEVCGVDLMKVLVAGQWAILRKRLFQMLSQMTGCGSRTHWATLRSTLTVDRI